MVSVSSLASDHNHVPMVGHCLLCDSGRGAASAAAPHSTQKRVMQLLHLLLGLLGASCVHATRYSLIRDVQWTSEGGAVRINGQPFHIKGINWFGLDTPTRYPHGLWTRNMDEYLDFIVSQNFNAIRVPLSLNIALDFNLPQAPGNNDPTLQGLTAGDVLEQLIDRAAARGLLIMLDMHKLEEDMFVPPELWYSQGRTYNEFQQGWVNLVARFGNRWNIVGLDLLNQPHGRATWNAGNPSTDWDRAAEDTGAFLLRLFPEYRGLLFIEGVQGYEYPPSHWGEDLRGVRNSTIDLGSPELNRRVVYSPHTYGPAVAPAPYFNDPNFPRNLPAVWDELFGFVERQTGNALVVGEWGGTYVGADAAWQDEFSAYLRRNCIADNFYWTLNPNSGDAGGILLDDWRTPNQAKLNLLAATQPSPSRLVSSPDGSFIFTEGAYPNPDCPRA